MEDLLARMRERDREAAAEFMRRYGMLIRRRLRQKLRPAARRLFDSLDLLSTVARRLDRVVGSGRLTATSLSELWGLIHCIAEHSLIDKARIYSRIARIEGPNGEVAARARMHESQSADKGVGPDLQWDTLLRCITSDNDLQIAALWLRGAPHGVIAQHVDMTPAAVRKRWQRIKEEIRRGLYSEAHDGCE